ncbi:glutamine ABC transporter ATP-binding protein [Leuconostoc litchii]|uniref:Amino acid ABC transporter ATP-binding protein n=1 Tax=Leuconostoc litchii TaxID=1981069 RepID=A0A6P2CLF1_9LACO|nr:amino acid ABC transporter ATP-binding protein [Leuconostoc litchii]TYC46098.1 amino acid ABC transporter ATP-binding protein [Leuconostoc litchii]GMA69818.1 glutamine ABC transporter ATP-binding protein [Leuconostoc litchii]
MSEHLIEVRNLNKFYGKKKVLDEINVTIPKNKVTVLLGPSGSGKSTMIRTFNGLEPFNSGTITLFGETIAANNKKQWAIIQTRIGMVFQSYDLFPNMTVIKNILLGPLKVQKRSREEVIKKARDLLKEVGLEDYENAYPRELSGGQKQRVAIVRALILNPELMLFDEVTASLDPEMVRGILDILKNLANQNLTMVIVTHEMNFARQVADKVIFLENGKIIEQGDGQSFFENPTTKRAEAFLESMSF